MSDYTQITDFSAKDALSTGDPEKLILGSDFDAEFAAISTAVGTKYDSNDLASQAEAEAETTNSKLVTPLRLANWADANGGLVGDIQALTDPGADRILFWDDGAGAAAFLTVSTGLTLSGTNLTSNDSAIVHDSLSGFVANEHVNHASVTLTAGNGLSGGGDITTNRSFALDLNELGTETSIAAGDFLAMVDITDSGSQKITFANLEAALSITESQISDLGTYLTGITGESIESLSDVASMTPSEGQVLTYTSGSWNASSGSGVTKYKTADEAVSSSTTLQDDDHLAGWALEAGEYYKIEGFLRVDGGTVGDMKLSLEFTNTPQTWLLSSLGVDTSSALSDDTTGPSQADCIVALSSNLQGVVLSGMVQANASTGGTMDFQWAQFASDATAANVRKGSWMSVTKVS